LRANTEREDIGLVTLSPRVAEAPPPPDPKLLAVTKQAWADFWASPLVRLVSTSTDLMALRRLFWFYDESERAMRAYRQQRLVPGSTRNLRLNPVLKAIDPSAILALEDRFGLSPRSRLELGVILGDAARSLADLNAELDRDDDADEPDDEFDPRLVALDGTGKVVARSRPVALDESVAGAKPAELGLPWAAPSGPKKLLLTCEKHHLCEAALQGAELTLRDTGVGAAQGLSVKGGDLWIEQKGQMCVRWRDGQARPGPAVRCPGGREDAFDGGLPVDGALASGVEGDAQRCRVRHEIALPELHEKDDALRGGAALVVTEEPTLRDDLLSVEVVTRADRLAIAWARAGSTVVRRDVGVALPAGSVEVTPAQLEGRPAWRVRVRAPHPVHPSRHCEQGRWVLRASYGPAEQPSGDDAWVNRYQEFGHCE